MPIGKNAIKRVSNSGYSNVQTTAPDMENSAVAEKKEEAAPKVEVASVAPEAVKEAPKKTTKKTTKKPSPIKQQFEHIAIGDSLPYYLL
ncbi:MAG: hypothetical protein IJD42_06465 [Clostridia bacterium]|nr:hypothetical protein [Clostridia bacterium]MBQ3041224.1 hypothetical protein [Clostridia bacterium]